MKVMQISVMPKHLSELKISVKCLRLYLHRLFFVFAFIQACEIHSLLCLREILKSLILKSKVQSLKYRLLVSARFAQLNTMEVNLDPFIPKLLLL